MGGRAEARDGGEVESTEGMKDKRETDKRSTKATLNATDRWMKRKRVLAGGRSEVVDEPDAARLAQLYDEARRAGGRERKRRRRRLT